MAGGFDTSGFVLPDNKFEGLYKDAADLNQANRIAALAAQKKQVQKNLADKYIGNEYKNMFTGTPMDAMYNHMIPAIKNQMEDLIEKGADIGEATMATYPMAQQMQEYATNAKDFQLKNNQALQAISQSKDINKDEFTKEVMNRAFPIDPKTGVPDVSQYDPNKDYWTDALNNGSNVLNNNGVKSFFDSIKPKGDNNVYKYTAPNGTSTYNRNSLIYKPFMQPIEDPVKGYQGIEPKYEVATDEGNTILHQYGEQKGQPVRLLRSDVWKTLPDRGRAYYIQEARNDIEKTGSQTPIDSQQAENLGRAKAYDDANQFGQSGLKTNFNNQANKFDKYAFADYNNRLRMKFADYTGNAQTPNKAVTGNVLNGIEIPANTPDGEYTMAPGGNKQNLGDIQNVVGTKILPDWKIQSNDPADAINYRVKDNKVDAIKIDNKWYDRNEINNMQLARDKEPAKSTHQQYSQTQKTIGQKQATKKASDYKL